MTVSNCISAHAVKGPYKARPFLRLAWFKLLQEAQQLKEPRYDYVALIIMAYWLVFGSVN